jgi:hypothetical protein
VPREYRSTNRDHSRWQWCVQRVHDHPSGVSPGQSRMRERWSPTPSLTIESS